VALHIARIELENFRNFHNLVIDPFPATALIVGENAVGKTNLLYALRLVLDPDLPDTARVLRSEDIFDGCGGIAEGPTVRIAIELGGFDEDDATLGVLSMCLLPGESTRARIEYRFTPRISLHEEAAPLTVADYDWELVGGPVGDTTVLRREPRRSIALRVLSALRDANEELTGRRSPLRDLLDSLAPSPTSLAAAADQVNAAMDDLITDPAVGGLQTAIRAQTVDMVGTAAAINPTLGFAPANPDQLLRQVRIYADSDRRRGLTGTGVGIANVVYLSLLMERVNQRRTFGDQVTTILGVEEPEAHLHVQMQRRLFGYLLRNEPALLLTSHSAHVAAVAPLSSIVLLRATPNGSVATTALNAGLSAQQIADLERYLDATRAEVLFARTAILVEGDAERYVVPALARAAGLDLDAFGISVVSVQGTDFQPFRRLLGPAGLDIPHVIVTDGDRRDLPYPASTEGFRRAVPLCAEPLPADLANRIPLKPVGDGHQPIAEHDDERLRKFLENQAIHIGDTTLEIDVARLFPQAFYAAVDDLFSQRTAAEVKSGIDKIVAGHDELSARTEVLRRVERIGKGRFAQRLADHLTRVSPDAIRAHLAAGRPEAYLIRALDAVSRAVGHPFADEASENW
jgi:putative ATP-dependent endonuclease of the OLD family